MLSHTMNFMNYQLLFVVKKYLVGVHRLTSVVMLQKLGSSLNVTSIYTLSYPDAFHLVVLLIGQMIQQLLY